MIRNKTILTLTLLACFAAVSGAQKIGIGDTMPKIPTEELINTKFKSPADLKGKLVLVEFFRWN
ncbi:MAG: hypothetical protein ACI97A_001521 [Planctomycetota bacterium]|jgi:hypothetical protein